jgi:hypothetical protein
MMMFYNVEREKTKEVSLHDDSSPKVHCDSMENLAELEECPASEMYLPSCLVEEDTRIGWCHCCKRQVPVYQEDGHWVFAWHTVRADPRPYMEVLPPLK